MRLDRYVSQSTGMPRSHATPLIRGGQVTVAGAVVRDPAEQVVPGRDAVTVRGVAVREPGHLLLMMHKPVGVITTTEQGRQPTVMELVPADLRHRDLAPIGRLDKDTTGLLLLTTDGGLNHALTHPRRHVEKAYLAELDCELQPDAEARFLAGLVLDDGTLCKPAGLERLGPLQVRVLLREGRFHQVKRMITACGSTVVSLHRERIGALWLDPALPPGEVRMLRPDEVQLLGIGAGQAPADALQPAASQSETPENDG